MFKIIKKLLFYFFVFLFTGLIIWIMFLFFGGRDAAILMYHSVGESVLDGQNLNIRQSSFERQMKFF